MMLRLPLPDGRLEPFTLSGSPVPPTPAAPARSRVAFTAAHVVADPHGDNAPGRPAVIDWDRTLAFRRHLWSLGLGVADAMDTAQRGMGLDWDATQTLIRRSAAAARDVGGRIAVGAGTDQLPPTDHNLEAVTAAYTEQLAVTEDAGAQPILMASRALCAAATSPDDYHLVYGRLLSQVRRPVILHWLGDMFDPELAGYWGAGFGPDGLDRATDVVVEVIKAHADKVDGIKVSLLDADREVALRRRLPDGVRLYTGDDFHYPDLIRGDDTDHSHALLGVFAAIAPSAAAALRALDEGDHRAYDRIFAPTVPLARHLFAAPTYYYKTGITFLAWLNGHQPGFTMVGGLHSGRSLPHLAETFRLADAAGALSDPDLAVARLRTLLAVHGVDA